MNVIAVTKVGEGYAALLRSPEGATELRWLNVRSDGGVEPGDRFGPPLPSDLNPTALTATSDGVLVGGGRIVVIGEVPSIPDSETGGLEYLDPSYEVEEVNVPVRSWEAALLRVADDAVEELVLPPAVARTSSFSVIEAMAPAADGSVRALVAHSGADDEVRYASNLTVVVVERDRLAEVGEARDLGESGPNHLAGVPDGPIELLVNRSDATYSRFRVDQPPEAGQGVRAVSEPRSGRALAAFEQGTVVAEPETGTVSWESATDHPAPDILSELESSPDGSPVLLPVTGDSERAAVALGGQLHLVHI